MKTSLLVLDECDHLLSNSMISPCITRYQVVNNFLGNVSSEWWKINLILNTVGFRKHEMSLVFSLISLNRDGAGHQMED